VTGAFAIELAKPFDVVERHRELSQDLVLRVDRPDPTEVEGPCILP